MIICPYCDAENIEGSDGCDACGQPLADLHLPTPETEVERGILRDRLTLLEPKTPIVVTPEMPAGEVLQLMVEKKIGCVFVVEADRVVGVFTERDALHRIGVEAQQLRGRPISQFMTPDPHNLDSNAKIAFAIRMMDLGGYRHVPVADADGKLTGVISIRDILGYLTDKMAIAAG